MDNFCPGRLQFITNESYVYHSHDPLSEELVSFGEKKENFWKVKTSSLIWGHEFSSYVEMGHCMTA